VIQRLAPSPGGSDGYGQVFLYPVLPDEITKRLWSQAVVQRYILRAGFARNNAVYFSLLKY